MFSKYKENAEREFAPVYFNSTTKTEIDPKENLDRSFQEVFNRFDNWISEASGWVIESIAGEYVYVSIYSPLSRSSHIEWPYRLRNSRNGLINMKSNSSKCFFWYHIRHLNPLKTHPKRKTKPIDKWLVVFIMIILIFLSLKRVMVRLNWRIAFALMCFVIKIDFNRFMFHKTKRKKE